MDPVSAMISGGANLASGMFSSLTSASNTAEQIQAQEQMQQQTEQFNAQQAQIARDYNTQMSNSAYQRSTADMKAAGLNPAMMFGSGGPASVPSSPTASVGTPNVPTPQRTALLANLGSAVQQGMNTAVQTKTMDKMADEMANLKAENAKIYADVDTSRATATEKTQAAGLLLQESRLREAQTAVEKNRALTATNEMSINPTVRKLADQAAYGGNKVSDVLAPIISSANTARRFMSPSSFY